jgi:hypothetical protein
MAAFGVVTALLNGTDRGGGGDDRPGPKLAVLIVDGVNNHDWQRATYILKSILLESGRFTVDVATSPPANAPPEE